MQICPVDCVVSDWSSPTACSVTCGSGTQSMTRSITVAQVGTGLACPQALTSSQYCNNGVPVII